MVDYERMSTLEVQRLAKQGDKDALFEMRYRYPENEEVPGSVWAAYWDEKAAAKGHVYAKRLLAGFFIDMPSSANFSENRQKAMTLFENIVQNYEAGKLDENNRSVGIVAKLELGIMLCEGLGTERNCKRGVELITSGEEDMKSFGGLKYAHLYKIGELYGAGYAQEDDEPTNSDLKKAIGYLENAIKKSEGVDPKYLNIAKELLENKKKYLREREEYKTRRREKFSQPKEIGQQGEKYIRELRERLAREGW